MNGRVAFNCPKLVFVRWWLQYLQHPPSNYRLQDFSHTSRDQRNRAEVVLEWARRVNLHGPNNFRGFLAFRKWPISERWQFSTPLTEFTPRNRSPKKLVQVITSAAPTAVPNLAQIRLWGLLGKSVKYNENFIYWFIPFWGTHLQVRPVDGFSRLMAQTTRTRAVVCLLVVSLILLPIFGVKSPQNPNFGGVNRRFQAKQQNIESYILSKILHRFQPNFAQPIETTK